MGWVRISDDFYDHPAHAVLELDAWGLWVWSLAWSNRNLTDGKVPSAIANRMDPDGKATAALIDSGRWEPCDGGIVIHDYHDFQPSAQEVRARRAEISAIRAEAGRKGAANRWQPDSKPMANVCPQPQPQPQLSSNEERAAPSRRGKTAIPEKFEVSDEMRAWVLERYPLLDSHRETEKFVAWAKANDRRYADWLQAWRNWMHKASEGGFR